jgi:hypothetical protein
MGAPMIPVPMKAIVCIDFVMENPRTQDRGQFLLTCNREHRISHFFQEKKGVKLQYLARFPESL